jgi:LmbE family N-acetylglucosaminyl deacetylase
MPSLAFVFAHPDDETFSSAGTIRRAVDRGVRCHLYCATDGDAGRSSGIPVSSRAELGALRRNELLTAARLLGIADVVTAGHPDGALGTAVDQDALVGEIVAFLRRHRPQAVVTFGPEGAPNRHRDHRVVSRATTAAFFLAGYEFAYPEQLSAADGALAVHRPARLFYVTWALAAPHPRAPLHGLPADVVVDITAHHPVKRAAFEAHATQRDHRAVFEETALLRSESFALAAGAPPPRPAGGGLPDDLLAGLP